MQTANRKPQTANRKPQQIFKLSTIAALIISISGCLGGGSDPVKPNTVAQLPGTGTTGTGTTGTGTTGTGTTGTGTTGTIGTTPAPAPAGLSVSANYTANTSGTVGNSGVLTNKSINAATLTTVGAIGRNNSTGDVTSATLNTAKATQTGNSLTIGNVSPEGVFNLANAFDATNNFAGNLDSSGFLNEKSIQADTATPINSPTVFYSYLTFGSWQDCTGCISPNEVGVIGAFVYGLATDPAVIMLKSGSATYTGSIRGQYVDAAGVISERTRANLSSTANFTARTVSFATTGSITSSGTNAFVPNSGLDMTGNLSYSAGSNQFTGAVTATGLSGTATGKFFGPAAQEIGGVFSLQGSAGNHDGLFIGK